MNYGILVYDRGELRFSKAFRNLPLDIISFAFSKYEDKHPQDDHPVYAIEIRPMVEDHSQAGATTCSMITLPE